MCAPAGVAKPLRSPLSIALALLLLTQIAHAERKYHLSSELGLYAGFSNSLGTNSSYTTKKLSPYYHVSPSLDLKTEGSAFDLDLSYTFSFDRYQQTEKYNIKSHAIDANFSSQLSEKIRLTVNNGFYTTPDYITYTLARGILLAGDQFRYVYWIEPSKLSQRTNNSRASLHAEVGPRSFLTFTGGVSILDYDGDSAAGMLNDQKRFDGSLAYSRRTGDRQTWSARYRAVSNRYPVYGNSLSQSALLGFTRQLKPSVSLSFEGGPSYVTQSRTDRHYFGYSGSVSLSKTTRSTQLSLHGGRRAGDSSGVGYTSDTDDAGLSFAVRLSKRMNASLTAAAYRTSQRLDAPLRTRGVNGGLHLSWLFGRHYSLGCGVSYRATDGYSSYNRNYRQAYVSLSLLAPDFWKGSR